MRRLLSVIAVVTFVGLLFAQEAGHRYAAASYAEQRDTTAQSTPQRRRVDFMADVVKPYQMGSDSIVYFVGNFAAHHNGAVISCDSAVRFADTRWGFFGRVLVNQDSIYIYGDSALYDGEGSTAEIYAPIIKVVDGDAMLYTYNFRFNTEERIGTYTDGGVLVHDDNIIESMRGYYNARTHDIICVDDVELHGADYDMKSDSVIYNTDSEFARFFTSSEIWNVDGDYLSADEGFYDKARELYMITRNGYILSAEQEMWGDTLEYYRADEHVIARNNIQMDDFENKMLAFGDYAEYWSDPGNAILTRNPSTISYDTTQSDSVFMRADTMHLLTIFPYKEKLAAEAAAKAKEEAKAAEEAAKKVEAEKTEVVPKTVEAEAQVEAKAEQNVEQSPAPRNVAARELNADENPMAADSTARDRMSELRAQAVADKAADEELPKETTKSEKAEQTVDLGQLVSQAAEEQNLRNITTDEEQTPPQNIAQNEESQAVQVAENEAEQEPQNVVAQDSVAVDSLAQDSVALSPKQLKQREAEAARKLKQEEKRAKAAERKARLDSIGQARVAKMREMLEKQRAKDLERMAKDSIRRAEQRAKLIAKGKDVSYLDREDSLASIRSERIRNMGSRDTTDSVSGPTYSEAPQTDSLAQEQKQDSIAPDSSYRLIKAYRNVKLFRKDAQMVCDSLTSSSQDSVVHLYINPVLWNGANQLSSQLMDIYSRNQQIERAEFTGDPITVAQIDTTYYNQVTGKKMISFFRDNDIYRNDVDGNVQTIYFNREDETTTVVTEMIYLEGASASFYIEERELVGVTYRNNVPITMYPIDQIPPDQPMRLPNFKWTPELRPALDDVFDRTIRPSRREESGLRERPLFDIVERMDRRKEELMLQGVWYDREDELSPEVVEWRDSRGRE